MYLLVIFATVLATCHCEVEMSDRARNFSTELFYFTAKEMNWHTVIAPLGIWNLLAGVSMGTMEDSKVQLRHGLFLPGKKDEFLSNYATFMKDVIHSETPNVLLKNKNYIFIEKESHVDEVYRWSLKYKFYTEVIKLLFEDPEISAKVANNMIRKTNTVDFDVFQPSDFSDMGIILTNVISFKGQWQSAFNASETQVEPFYDEKGNFIYYVNMMQKWGSFASAYMHKIKATVLELPYNDERHSFIVLLPDTTVSVDYLCRALGEVSVKQILGTLEDAIDTNGSRNITIKLPRFKITTNVVLNKPLQNMGVINIFNPNSNNFEKISGDWNMYVSSIIHKAQIEVTETETIASASSSATSPIRPEARFSSGDFTANRPFLYFIVEKSTATMIFSGIYSKPTIY